MAGTDRPPILTELLVAAGVYDIAAWREGDARAVPLQQALDGVDVVIDLRSQQRLKQRTTTPLDMGNGPRRSFAQGALPLVSRVSPACQDCCRAERRLSACPRGC